MQLLPRISRANIASTDPLPPLPAVAMEVCRKQYSLADQPLCLRAMAAARRLGWFFSTNWHVAMPRFETPDPTAVTTTIKDHPTPQCRLDTFFAALQRSPRPKCWYAGTP